MVIVFFGGSSGTQGIARLPSARTLAGDRLLCTTYAAVFHLGHRKMPDTSLS